MRTRLMAIVAAAGVIAASALLAGCGPKNSPTAVKPPTGVTPAAIPTTSAAAIPAVRDVTPGNCTLYKKADAIQLLGGVNANNKALPIDTTGGTKIDLCSYLDLKGTSSLEGLTYGVVRYDSDATAFAMAQKLQTEMLGSATDQNWSVQPLASPAPGAGPLLGGFGTKTEDGLTYTIAVVGTNVGPYLVTALGASTVSADHAKNIALLVFQALNTAVG